MKRVVPLILVLLLTVVMLSGCVEGKFHVTLNTDGSADVNYRIGFDSTMMAFMQTDQETPLEEMRREAEAEGFKVSNYNENNMLGIIATKHVDSLDRLPNFVDFGAGTGTDKKPLVIKEGFFRNDYYFETNLDLSDMKEAPEDDLGGLGNAMLNQVDLRFVLTLPFSAEEHNAAVVTDNGRTLEWQLIPGQDNEMTMHASVLNVTNIMLVVTGSVILLVSIVFLLNRRKTQRAEIIDEND